MINQSKLKTRLLVIILVLLVLNSLAMFFHWYSLIWYLDMFMHFIGGFWLGLLFLFISSKYFPISISISNIIIFVLLFGIAWEIFEIIVDQLITLKGLDYVDSSSDLFFDLLGGLFSYFYFQKRISLNQ